MARLTVPELDRFGPMLDHMLEPPRPVRRVEVITGAGGRRRWSADEKARIIAQALAPGAVVSAVARRYGMSPQHLFTWCRQAKQQAGERDLAFAPVIVANDTPRPEPVAAAHAPIEIAIGGALIRVPPGADARMLTVILRALTRPR